MPLYFYKLPKIPLNFPQFSTLSSPSDLFLAEKAITFLKRHPYLLDSLSSQFTPQAASYLLHKTQFDQTLILQFLVWAKQHQHFFTPHCKCLALHVLTRFKLFKSAQVIAESIAFEGGDEKGNLLFLWLKDSYHDFNSSSAVFDLLVKSYSHVNMIDKALNVINLTKSSGFMPGVLSYNSVLDAIIRVKSPVKFAEEVYVEMIRNGISPNVFSYNIMIRGFCNSRELEKGLTLFQEMDRNGCLPNVVTFNTLIDAYCKLGKMTDAFKFLEMMLVRGCKPNLISYNVVINGLCREGRVKETSGVLKEMSTKGFFPDEVTYNTLVNGYCKDGNFHQALLLHEEMVKNGLSPNVVTYTSLINSMCKAKNLNRAMEFMDQIRVRGLSPNERTYTTLIDGFAQQGFVNEAYRFLGEMTKNGFSPSLVTYNALIHGHCVLGKMEDALTMVQDMVAKGLVPDKVSYGTIISGFSKNGDLEKAFQINREMVETGILPDVLTYSSLIKGLCEKRKLIEACDLFQEMLKTGLPPDEFTYTTLINAYCIEGDIKKAMSLHNEMLNRKVLPDVVTYSVLINGLNKQARTREAKCLLFKLFYEDSVPNDVTYNTLIENCSNIAFQSAVALLKGFCLKGLMNEADRVFESLLEKNNKSSETVYNVIIHGHCRDGNSKKAYNLYKEMMKSGFVPHTVTVIALTKELMKRGMSEELNDVVSDVLRSCRVGDGELAKVLVEINRKEGNMDAVLNLLVDMAKDGLLPNSSATDTENLRGN